MAKKNVKRVMSKYDFDVTIDRNPIDYTELVTVPDQVLSMYEIYQKYAVRGEIAGLANNIRPHTTDDLDDFDEAVDFVPEEDVDILQRSHSFRMASEAKAKEESNTIKTPEVEEAEPPAVGDNPSSDTPEPDADPGS